MKFLVAIALLALAVAEATHTATHNLRNPRFKPGRHYRYDVELNVTAGVLGLDSQVSAAVLRAEVGIYAKTEREHILKIENVYTSGSVMAIEHKYGDIPMRPNRELEDRLSTPIMFTLENGKVVSYTLSERENLESKKIKKSILRSLEMYVPESALHELESTKNGDSPVTYNTTEETEYGMHSAHYMITVSPYTDFPYDEMVYNISRVDSYESERYPGYHLHHNFHKHGCPEVCRKEWRNNRYGAGCPYGYQPHQGPVHASFNHEHSLSIVQNVLSPEIIRTVEVHYAKMYDQDMEVLIRYLLTRTEVTSKTIEEPSRQQTYTDLHDMESEINEKEIADLCSYKKTDEAVVAAKNLLKTISKIIVDGELSQSRSYLIGEKAILLRDVLAKLLVTDLWTVAAEIKPVDNLKFATDEEKVKRQIWLDILPVVGTQESVKFIVEYITKEIREKNMLVWEATEILESMPQNLKKADTDTIREMRKLTKNTELVRKSVQLHSAIHLTMARIIGEVCHNVPILRSQPKQKASWFGQFQDAPRSMSGPVMCPEQLVSEIVEEMTRKLRETRVPSEIAIYIQTLTHIGTEDVLPVISEYVYGTADNLQMFSLRFIDFTKTMTQFALHNMAGRYPEEVLDIVVPVFFNETETPKVRNAAFGVLIRCQPPLAILEKVVMRSWTERSYEVGSFVTSTMETFGNSSLPCMDLTAERIQMVMPQLKRFDIGMQHAKNYMWTYFDDDNELGIEARCEHTPNNESFVPSTIYKSLSYSLAGLKNVILQSSLNIEGLTQEKILERITEYLDVESVETIEKEDEVFGRGDSGLNHIHPRTVDDLRLTTYTKMFYRSSYYYIDSTNVWSYMKELNEMFVAYLKKTESQYSGYLVKLMIPSSYHTKAVAKTLPYPVEFEMRHPVILALRVRTSENSRMPPSHKHFDLSIRPSVYVSKLYTHQMMNLGDCKEVGVYHEHKVAITYPFELKYDVMSFPNVTIRYKVPPKSKRILSYYSESGTYAGKKELETLPLTMEKQPIRTLPTPFKFERDINLVGIPPLRVQLHTEDMNLLTVKLPRTPAEALDMALKRILNAGWRYKSVNVTVLEDENLWTGDTEATFRVEYSRQHIPKYTKPRSPQDARESAWSSESHWQKQPQFSSSWKKHPQPSNTWQRKNPDHPRDEEDDPNWRKFIVPTDSVEEFTENAREITKLLNFLMPHISHVLNVSVTAEPLHSMAYFRMELNHTYEKDLYLLHAEAVSRQREGEPEHQISLDHLIGYSNRPDEFTYDKHYGKQDASFLTAISLPQGRVVCPWEHAEIAITGEMHYESNQKILENELLERVHEKYFLPEKHEECLRDVRAGKPWSVNCIEATREYSIFNKLNMDILWDEEMPHELRQLANVVDTYLKHYFFEHLDFKTERNDQKKVVVSMDYIDKFVDEPVVDIEVKKPTETVTLRRIPVGDVRPLSSVYNIYETVAMDLTNNTYPPTCMLMENYVKTYDLKTFEFHPKDCHYVLTSHCTKRKNFAVIVHGTKEIYVHLGTNTVILSPEGGVYKMKYNGRELRITEPTMLHERDEIYVYTEAAEDGEGDTHIRLVAKKAGIFVLYDGKNVKVEVSPRYKGEMCGLCSEFDGEKMREFRGMDRCLYRDYVDFASSNMVKRGGSCKVERLRDERICDGESGEMVRRYDDDSDEGYEPRLPRNVIVTKGNEVCFSILPVPVCNEGDEPRETTSQSLSFHCLPKRDVTAKKLINEAKWRPLEEIERKSVDYVQTVEVPKMC